MRVAKKLSETQPLVLSPAFKERNHTGWSASKHSLCLTFPHPPPFFLLFVMCTAHNRRGVLVNFWNGQTKEVSSDQALRVPLPLSERIILELQMSLAARQMLVKSSLDYPIIVPPGYRASGHYRQGHYWPKGLYATQTCAKCCCRCISLPHCCLAAWEPTQPAECRVQQEDVFMPGTSLSEEELSKKMEAQLSEVRISSSDSVSREEEEKADKRMKTENVPKDAQSCLEEDNDVIEPRKVSASPGSSVNMWSAICNVCFVTSFLLFVPEIARGFRPGLYVFLLENGKTFFCTVFLILWSGRELETITATSWGRLLEPPPWVQNMSSVT